MGKRLLIAVCILLLAVSAFALDPEQKLTDVIKDYVVAKYPDWDRGEINVIYKEADQLLEQLKAAPGDARLRVAEVYEDFRPVGNVILPLEIVAGSNEVQRIFVRARIEVRKKIVAASRLIKKGKLIEDADLKLEERDVAMLPQKYFIDPSLLVSKEAKLSIPENSTMFQWMIGDLPLVRRGSEVAIVVSEPGLAVRARGLALEDGYLDGAVRVKRTDSNKVLVCKVVATGEVEVEVK